MTVGAVGGGFRDEDDVIRATCMRIGGKPGSLSTHDEWEHVTDDEDDEDDEKKLKQFIDKLAELIPDSLGNFFDGEMRHADDFARSTGYEDWADVVLKLKRAGKPLVLIHPEDEDVVVLQSMNSGSVMVALNITESYKFADCTEDMEEDYGSYGYDPLTHQFYGKMSLNINSEVT